MFWKYAVPGNSKLPFKHGQNCLWDTPGPASFKRQATDGRLYSWSKKKVKAFPVLVHMRACHSFISTSISPRCIRQKQPKIAFQELLVRSVKEARNTSDNLWLPFLKKQGISSGVLRKCSIIHMLVYFLLSPYRLRSHVCEHSYQQP